MSTMGLLEDASSLAEQLRDELQGVEGAMVAEYPPIAQRDVNVLAVLADDLASRISNLALSLRS